MAPYVIFIILKIPKIMLIQLYDTFNKLYVISYLNNKKEKLRKRQ